MEMHRAVRCRAAAVLRLPVSITFTLTDDTAITLEYLQGSGEGTADDIAVGSVLEVVLDEDNQAVSVTVRNLNAGGGFGGSGEVTNGTSANTITKDTEVDSETYTSTGDDENALRVDGAAVTLKRYHDREDSRRLIEHRGWRFLRTECRTSGAKRQRQRLREQQSIPA